MKVCRICEIEKPLSEFYSRQRKTCTSYSYCCKPCHLSKMQKDYKKNSVAYKSRAKKAREKMREFIIQQKSKPCTDCKKTYPHYVMDFDHLDPNTKSFNIGTWKGQSKENLIKEIAKCELVCANCHRIRTHSS